MDIDALTRQFGQGVGTPSIAQDSSIDDLVSRFSEGVKAQTIPTPVIQKDSIPPQPGEPITGDRSQSIPAIEDIKNAPAYLRRKTIQNFKEAKALAGQGITNISQGLSAQGVGELAMGTLGMPIAPISAAISGVDRFAKKMTGNPKFAPAELIATTGLPIAKVGKTVVKTMPSTRAIDELVETIGIENIPKVIDDLRSNPRLVLADVDPNVQYKNMGLASEISKPHRVLKDFSDKRIATQKGTIVEAYDEAMGVPVGFKAKIDSLKNTIKDVGKEINPVLDNTGAVDVTPVIASIDDVLKPGLQSVVTMGKPLAGPRVKEELAEFRKYLTDDKSQRTDAKELHSVQSALRAKAEDLLNSTDGQNRQVGYALMDIRNQIVNAIDKASPQIENMGSYKPKLAKYRDVNDIEDAFQKGQLITKNRLGRLEDHPDYWQEWISKATPAELEAAKEGARLAVAYQMGAFKNAATKALDIPQAEFNAEKLSMLFGVKETTKLMKALNDERRIKDTDTKLFQNSLTAMRLAAQKMNEVREDWKPNTAAFLPAAAEIGASAYSGGSTLGMAAGSVLGYQAIRKGITKAGQSLDRQKNLEVANLSIATGEAREALIKALQDKLPANKLTMKQKLQLAFPVNP